MKTMILAAGLGQRMMPLTAATAKPLLKIGSNAIIEHLLIALQQQNLTDIIINVHHHSNKIMKALGDGTSYGVNITYSIEPEQCLGTGGGVYHALPLLGDEPFLLISGDIYSDFPFNSLGTLSSQLAHLVLVPNPPYHHHGDFNLTHDKMITKGDQYTYANIAILSPRLFSHQHQPPFDLAPLLYDALAQQQITGEVYHGMWHNVGSIDILKELNT